MRPVTTNIDSGVLVVTDGGFNDSNPGAWGTYVNGGNSNGWYWAQWIAESETGGFILAPDESGSYHYGGTPLPCDVSDGYGTASGTVHFAYPKTIATNFVGYTNLLAAGGTPAFTAIHTFTTVSAIIVTDSAGSNPDAWGTFTNGQVNAAGWQMNTDNEMLENTNTLDQYIYTPGPPPHIPGEWMGLSGLASGTVNVAYGVLTTTNTLSPVQVAVGTNAYMIFACPVTL